jgi:hypothetical protein
MDVKIHDIRVKERKLKKLCIGIIRIDTKKNESVRVQMSAHTILY